MRLTAQYVCESILAGVVGGGLGLALVAVLKLVTSRTPTRSSQ